MNLEKEVLQVLEHSFPENEDHLSALLHHLTLPPLYTTLRVDLNKVDEDTALDSLTSYLQQQCSCVGRQPYQMFPHPSLKDCVVIQNRGPKSIKEEDQEVVVDLSCGMAVLRGAHVYRQGIMGASHSLRSGDSVSVYADLAGKCLKGLATKYSGTKLHVGNGVSQVARTDIFNSDVTPSSGLGVLMTDPIYEAPSLADVPLDWIYPQNLPSITCVHVLDPRPGETVLDMCAAPGGKTSHIAALMKGKGRLVAIEKSRKRARRMETLMADWSEIYTFDSTQAVGDQADSKGCPPYPPATFDRILVDAPCSALGQRPCHVNRISVNQLRSFPVIQHKLLVAAVQLVKPGGVVVYSTCTVTREENEDQVTRLLTKCPDVELVTTPFKLGGDGLPGCDLTEEQRSKVQRFDPSILSYNAEVKDKFNADTIGFFIAKFQKQA